MEQEIWKDIVGYEGKYQVSNLGNIKSLKNGKWGLGKETILKNNLGSNGYYSIDLHNNIRKNYTIHRLVAQAFISNIENKPYVNHKDGNKLNNMVENLEWCTSKENVIHRFKILGHQGSGLGRFGKHSHNHKQVKQYNKEGKLIKTFDCIRDVEKELGIYHGNISNCCKGKVKTAGGFIWKYVD